jgi:hypothetical protein
MPTPLPMAPMPLPLRLPLPLPTIAITDADAHVFADARCLFSSNLTTPTRHLDRRRRFLPP